MSTIYANDPQIQYSSGWEFNDEKFPGVRWTTQYGSTAKYVFNGTRIEVFGTFYKNHPKANFIVDSQPPKEIDWRNYDPFFSSTNLTQNLHTLTIMSEKGLLVLNRIVVNDFHDPSPHPDSNSPEDSTTPPPTSASSPPHSNSTTQSSSLSSSKANNIGDIVGGVIAGLVALASLIAFVLYRRRKRIQVARRTSPYAVTPFITEYSKSSSPEPIKDMQTADIAPLPTLSFPSEMGLQDELPPAFIAGSSNLGRHGSMYKPRQSVESLPPTEFGYGGGLSREEWSRYTSKSKS